MIGTVPKFIFTKVGANNAFHIAVVDNVRTHLPCPNSPDLTVVRNQCTHNGTKNLKATRRLECYGGIKIKSTIEIIKGIKLKDKNSSMIVQVGSNDIYSDLKVKVENTFKDYSILNR